MFWEKRRMLASMLYADLSLSETAEACMCRRTQNESYNLRRIRGSLSIVFSGKFEEIDLN